MPLVNWNYDWDQRAVSCQDQINKWEESDRTCQGTYVPASKTGTTTIDSLLYASFKYLGSNL